MNNLIYKEKNISDVINISFIRHNITYNKKIYFYLTDSMKENIIKNINKKLQFFADCTYNVIPWQNKNFKLFVLIAFNTTANKTELCSLVLLTNENVETFSNIYEYLIDKYNFYPTKMTVDCQKANIIAIQKHFPNCYIIICYFHIIRRFVLHLPKYNLKIKKKRVS